MNKERPLYPPEPDDMDQQPIDEDAEYEAERQRQLDEDIRQRKANKLMARQITDSVIDALKDIGGRR